MEAAALQEYLHEHIPLSAAMQAIVRSVSADAVILDAPLAPNINHRDTVFGGSASALAILAAWSLIHTRLASIGVSCRLVIQRNSVEYTAPMPGDFSATVRLAEPTSWERFLRTLERRGRARIEVACELTSGGAVCGQFVGSFVAITTSGESA